MWSIYLTVSQSILSRFANLSQVVKVYAGIKAWVPQGFHLVFNIHQSIVFCDSFTSSWSARFQMTCSKPYGEVGNEVVRSLAWPV